MSLRVISGSEVRKLLPMSAAIEVNAASFVSDFRRAVVNPDRIVMGVEEGGSLLGHTLFQPAHVRGAGSLGVKIVSVRADNAARGLPTVPSVVVCLDTETGLPSGLVDGTYLTALRTAAGSGAATQTLAKPDCKNLVVIGAGLQGRLHVHAMLSVRPSLKSVTLVNRTIGRAEELAKDLAGEAGTSTSSPADIAYSALTLDDEAGVAAAVAAADIVCTCTNSSAPVLKGEWLSPGTHINAIGGYTPDMAELDAAAVGRCRVVTDSVAAAWVAGDLKDLPRDKHDLGLLGAVLLSEGASLSAADLDLTLFKSVGVAHQDVSTAAAVLKRAEAESAGTEVALG